MAELSDVLEPINGEHPLIPSSKVAITSRLRVTVLGKNGKQTMQVVLIAEGVPISVY